MAMAITKPTRDPTLPTAGEKARLRTQDKTEIPPQRQLIMRSFSFVARSHSQLRAGPHRSYKSVSSLDTQEF